jgi:hypothetical protein
MSNYVKSTNFTAKDSLPSGNAGKIVKGTEIDTELTAVASAISSKADLNSPALTGTPTVPTATTGTNTTQAASTAFVQTAIGAALSGIIVMWSGTIATIPSGWVLCNGSNGTPDLRNRFIVGAHSDTAGVAYTTITGSNTQTGGSKDSIVISHTHTATVTDPGHAHQIAYETRGFTGGAANDGWLRAYPSSGSYVSSTSTTGITVSNSTEGSSGTNANLVPYYALAFIMKT